jgi:deoxyribose-phosphate aldolase
MSEYNLEKLVDEITKEVLRALASNTGLSSNTSLSSNISLKDESKGIDPFLLSPCEALTGECNACGHCPSKLEDKVLQIIQGGACRIGGTLGMPSVRPDLASLIDHTLLKPEATKEDVIKLCQEAVQHKFASVCINPSWVSLVKEQVEGSSVKVCTVVGFPLGATTTIAKVMETRDAIANGADEIDMVLNVGALKAKQDDLVFKDIQAVREASSEKILKVILETALLSDEEKVRACKLAKQAGADFVKTSTGFGPGGATVHDVALMRETVGEEMGVKASGGIRDYETALKMVEAGATRIGASASVTIVKKAAAGNGGKY